MFENNTKKIKTCFMRIDETSSSEFYLVWSSVSLLRSTKIEKARSDITIYWLRKASKISLEDESLFYESKWKNWPAKKKKKNTDAILSIEKNTETYKYQTKIKFPA